VLAPKPEPLDAVIDELARNAEPSRDLRRIYFTRKGSWRASIRAGRTPGLHASRLTGPSEVSFADAAVRIRDLVARRRPKPKPRRKPPRSRRRRRRPESGEGNGACRSRSATFREELLQPAAKVGGASMLNIAHSSIELLKMVRSILLHTLFSVQRSRHCSFWAEFRLLADRRHGHASDISEANF
jgi:hypothetical protein